MTQRNQHAINPTQTGSQVLVSMLSTAYEAHFNAPLFYRELQNNTVPRYSKMVSISFLASVVTMIAVRDGFWFLSMFFFSFLFSHSFCCCRGFLALVLGAVRSNATLPR